MKTFEYRGFDLSGRLARGLVEAVDAKEAREHLAARGILPEIVEPAGRDHGLVSGWRRRRLDASARADVYRELGALLKAGVPMLSAFQMAINSAAHPQHAVMLSQVRDRIREGGALVDSWVAADARLPNFERAALTAGERSGALDAVLEQLADYLEEQQRVQEKLKSALVYPLFVVALAIIVGVGLLGFVLPNLGRMFAETRMELPWLTSALLALGRQGWLLAALPIVLLALGTWWRHRVISQPTERERFDAARLRWPWLGKNSRLLVAARFSRTFSLLLRGGVGAVDAMELAGDATGNLWLANITRAEAEEVRHGKSIANAIKSIPPFSATLGGWIEAGEASGTLSELMDRAGRRLEQQWSQHLTRALNALEPALILIVGAFVLVIALAVLLPILSLNQTLS